MIEGERAALPFVHIAQKQSQGGWFRKCLSASEAFNAAADCEQALQHQFILGFFSAHTFIVFDSRCAKASSVYHKGEQKNHEPLLFLNIWQMILVIMKEDAYIDCIIDLLV